MRTRRRNALIGTRRRKRSADAYSAEKKLVEELEKSPALLTPEEVRQAESEANLNDWIRPAVLSFLAMSGKELIEKCTEDRSTAVALASLADRARAYRGNLQEFIKLTKAMEARIVVALACREDMYEVLAEATQHEAQEMPGAADPVDAARRQRKTGTNAR